MASSEGVRAAMASLASLLVSSRKRPRWGSARLLSARRCDNGYQLRSETCLYSGSRSARGPPDAGISYRYCTTPILGCGGVVRFRPIRKNRPSSSDGAIGARLGDDWQAARESVRNSETSHRSTGISVRLLRDRSLAVTASGRAHWYHRPHVGPELSHCCPGGYGRIGSVSGESVGCSRPCRGLLAQPPASPG